MNGLKHKLNHIWSFFKIPANVAQAFEEDAVVKNGITMKILALFMIVVEIFNIARVLFFSNAKLATLNNQIYFSMYVTLLVSAIVFALIEQILKNKKKERMRLYIVISYFWLLWHVALNCYDLSRSQNGDITLFSCAVLGLAIFAQLKPRHTLTIVTLAYIMLLSLSGGTLDAGGYINATISLILACFVALRVYILSIVQIYQHIEIADKSKQMQLDQAKLQSSLEKYDMVLNNTNDHIFEIDFQEERLVFSKNSRIAKRFGQEIVNVTSWLQTQTAMAPAYANLLIQGLQDLSTTKREGDYTFRITTRDGSEKWYQLRVFVIANDNTPRHGIGIISDIDAQYKQVELLTSRTKTDPMTGLLNAVAFQNYYDIALENLKDSEHLAMFMIDLDNFKTINDTYGHFAGDCVLKAVATVLDTMFRDCDFSARLGGDEFATIMKNVNDINVVKARAALLAQEMSKIEVTEHKIHIACSIGIAVTDDKTIPYNELYKRADKVLYEAKGCGKGCCRMSS